MTLSRRHFIRSGGGFAAALLISSAAGADTPVEITMHSSADGSKVWFDPIGILISPGQTVRWTNRDAANSHTTTAYDPSNMDHPRRIPPGAKAWNSGYLMPGESFSVTLEVEGVYDYFCIPHEMAGMVGRIIVGRPQQADLTPSAARDHDVPQAALEAFPAIDAIMHNRIVHHKA